jgi:phosphoadenylyl-sulfate reductase (thioredoxin)
VCPDLSPEVQARVHGPALWSRNPDQCCALPKVEPLRRKASGLRAWVTAIRRDQTSARAQAGRIEWDRKFQLVKVNPIVDWSSESVWSYIRNRDLPYNQLHDHHYPSIGCIQCTRPVLPGRTTAPGAGQPSARKSADGTRWKRIQKCFLETWSSCRVPKVSSPPSRLFETAQRCLRTVCGSE